MSITTEGKVTAEKGFATKLSSDWSGQATYLNSGLFIAGQVNSPENNVVYGGIHVQFSNNYAVQFAGRNSKFWARTFEGGTDKGWKRLLTTDDLSTSTDLTVNSLTTTSAVRSGGGELDIIGDTSERSAMNCGLTGYDSTGKKMGWYLGTYKSQTYKVWFEDYLGSEGVMLNGEDGSVQLYSGGQTGTAQTLTLADSGLTSTADLHLVQPSGTSGKAFVIQNSGNAYHDMYVQCWGNGYEGSDRYSVFEVKLSSGYLFFAQRQLDGTQILNVNGNVACTSLSQSSDRDLKDNIQVINDATAAIRKMNGYTYTLKENGLPYAGVIAQECMEAIPEAVGSFIQYGEELAGPTQSGHELREETRYLNVDYAAVTGLLVQVARETDDRVTALEEENASLRANAAVMDERITNLENQVSELVALVKQLTGSEE